MTTGANASFGLTVLVSFEALALALAAAQPPHDVSTGAVFCVVGLQVAFFLVKGGAAPVTPRVAPHLGLLLTFVLSYFGLMLAHGLMEPARAAHYGALVVCAYLAGYAIGRRGPVLCLVGTIAVVAGFVLLVAVGVRRAEVGQLLEIADRAIANPWGGGTMINAPGLGAFASLGMCLAGAGLFSGPARELPRGLRHLHVPLFLALAALGVVSNTALANRTPVVAMAVTLLGTAGFVMLFRRGLTSKLVPLGLGFVFLAMMIYFAVSSGFDFSDVGLVQRFSEKGLETPRYRAWLAVLTGMFRYPEGGRNIYLGDITYAHDLWLDVAYDAGPIPMILLLGFQLSHLAAAWRWLRRGAHFLVTLVLLGVAASYLATFVVEPAIAFSIIYFAMSCFYLGVLLGLDEWSEVPAREQARAAALAGAAETGFVSATR